MACMRSSAFFPDISGYPRAVVIHDCVELDGTPCICERQLLGDTFVTGFCAFKALEHNSYLNEISAGERRVLLPLV